MSESPKETRRRGLSHAGIMGIAARNIKIDPIPAPLLGYQKRSSVVRSDQKGKNGPDSISTGRERSYSQSLRPDLALLLQRDANPSAYPVLQEMNSRFSSLESEADIDENDQHETGLPTPNSNPLPSEKLVQDGDRRLRSYSTGLTTDGGLKPPNIVRRLSVPSPDMPVPNIYEQGEHHTFTSRCMRQNVSRRRAASVNKALARQTSEVGTREYANLISILCLIAISLIVIRVIAYLMKYI